MPSLIFFALVELGLKEIVAALTIIGLLAAALGFFYYTFRLQKNKVRDDATKQKADAAKEWRDVADAHAEKVKALEIQLGALRTQHETCEGRINVLTQFNLRLQSRERSYQRVINKLEIRFGLEPTDWNDITDAPASFSP